MKKLILSLFALLLAFGSGCSMLNPTDGQTSPLDFNKDGTVDAAPYVDAAVALATAAADGNPEAQAGIAVASALFKSGQGEAVDAVGSATTRAARLASMSAQLKAERLAMAEENEAMQAMKAELESAIVLDVPDPVVATNTAAADDGPAASTAIIGAPADALAELFANPLAVQLLADYAKTETINPATLTDPANAEHLAALMQNEMIRQIITDYLTTGDADLSALFAAQASTPAAVVIPSGDNQAELDALLKANPGMTAPPGWDTPADAPPGATVAP